MALYCVRIVPKQYPLLLTMLLCLSLCSAPACTAPSHALFSMSLFINKSVVDEAALRE